MRFLLYGLLRFILGDGCFLKIWILRLCLCSVRVVSRLFGLLLMIVMFGDFMCYFWVGGLRSIVWWLFVVGVCLKMCVVDCWVRKE